jgi:uncharacterized membrane protein
MAKTTVGLDENIAGFLCYVLGWVSGIYFLVKEKENKFVRFHAIQSIAVFGLITVIYIIIFVILNSVAGMFRWIPGVSFVLSALFGIFAWLLGLGTMVLWIILMAYAYQGQRFKLPWAGKFAQKRAEA